MSKGAFVLMKIPLYRGGESRRRMAANARRNDEMNRKRIIMPCTPSAPSTQSSMPLFLLGPPPYRILNILAYYRWSLALPSTLRKGISSVASSSPPCLDERRILFLCPPLDSSTPRLSYGGIRAKPVCLWHLSALFQPRISLPCLWEIIAQRYLIRWHWAWSASLSFSLSFYRLKILVWIVLICIVQDVCLLKEEWTHICRMKMIFLK